MKICEMLKKKEVGSIGIGAMIVFIAMVLVAGIAASVLIQTSTKLESQAMKTGQQTTDEVATGIEVTDIEGYTPATGGSADMDQIAICVRPRAGSTDIDLNETFVELSDTDYKIIMGYTGGTSDWNDSGDGVDDIFGVSCFPAASNRFGLMVLEDEDSSVSKYNPVLNRGDKVILCINTSHAFSASLGINERVTIWGMIVPEIGAPGIVSFRTPASYTSNVYDLQ